MEIALSMGLTRRDGGVAPWTPTDLSSLRLWWDASDTSMITGSPTVTSITDKSGNGYTATASGSPTTGSRTQNSRNVIDMDVADHFTNAAVSLDGAIDVLWIAVYTLDAIDNGTDSVLSWSGGAGDIQFDASSATQFDGRFVSTSNANPVGTGGPYPGPSIYIAEIERTSTQTCSTYIDGTKDIDGVAYTANPVSPGTFNVFTDRAKNDWPDGAFMEALIVTDVTQATREKIEGYLAHKWGLTANLPALHPYKSVAP